VDSFAPNGDLCFFIALQQKSQGHSKSSFRVNGFSFYILHYTAVYYMYQSWAGKQCSSLTLTVSPLLPGGPGGPGRPGGPYIREHLTSKKHIYIDKHLLNSHQ